jgi:hypothetical protein
MTLAEYKKHIKNIKHKKGTAAWLKQFVEIVSDYGLVSAKKNGKTLGGG